jgi:GAF domain-containing protein
VQPVTPMEPIPETVEAVDDLDRSVDDDLLDDLIRRATRGQEIVPDLVGVSIAGLDQGLTFTLVATAREIAVLDAIQYLAGGPCVEGAHTDEVIDFESDPFHEERWRLFAEATASRAVRSTLTLPVLTDGRVVGSVNLYGGSRRAFIGHHDQLAAVFGAWAAGAVANADLSFSTLREAQRAPEQVRDQNHIDQATGIIAAQLGVGVEAALAHLRDAAVRAGVSLLQLANGILSTHQQNPDAE